jgi:hypothetical protein
MAASKKLSESEKEEFRQQFCKEIVGQECWSIVAGEGTGTMVSIDFGHKILLHRPINNRHLPDDKRNFKGKYALFIQDAAWWVLEHGEVIGGWEDNNLNDGPMVTSLKKLVGKRVLSIDFFGKEHGFEMFFEENLMLKVRGVEYEDSDTEDYTDFTFFKNFVDKETICD